MPVSLYNFKVTQYAHLNNITNNVTAIFITLDDVILRVDGAAWMSA